MTTTLKQIIDVEPTKGMTRAKAVKTALRVASANVAEEYPEIQVKEIRPLGSRLKVEGDNKFWQVVAEVIEKKADFPPKDDEDTSDDSEAPSKPKGEGGDLPSKIQDVIDNHDDSELVDQVKDIISQLQSLVDSMGGDDDDKGDDEDSEDDPDAPAPPSDDIDAPVPPMDGPPVGKKPAFMAKTLELPKQVREQHGKTSRFVPVSRREAEASALELPKVDRELRGYRLASVEETDTHYVAHFTR